VRASVHCAHTQRGVDY